MGVVALAFFGAIPSNASAHFMELIPSLDIVSPETEHTVNLDLTFTHPMENGPAMMLEMPERFGVQIDGADTDLKATLKPRIVDGVSAFTASYTIKQPGDHIFYVEPTPYWEPAEGKMIIHYTKVVVDGFGAESGWDQAVGFPVEIEPLARPYGLWTGNIFRGIVRKNGQPVPFASIEVEYRSGGQIQAPFDAYITQTIKADGQGVFAYAMPRAGWWSFAALIDGDENLKNPEGKEVPVELGALIWVRTRDMK